MSLSDQVRSLFLRTIVDPARHAGQRVVYVAVSDLSQQLRWKNRYPLICSALIAEKFHREEGLELESTTSPCPSSSTIMKFRVA